MPQGQDLSDKLSGAGGGGRGPMGGPNFTDEEIQDMDTLSCDNCGMTTFTEAIELKIVPSVHPKTPPGQTDDALQPVKTLACVNCGTKKTHS